MTQIKRIIDTAAADFLTSPNTRSLLGPFINEERSMAEAAALLEMKLSTLHRRVKQMIALDLLEVTREAVQRGHRVKFYRATSPEFLVLIEATQRTNLETFISDGFRGSATILSRGVAKEMEARAPRWGFRIFWHGGVFQQATALGKDGGLLEPPPERRSFYGDCGLHLTRDDAEAFKLELQALYEKYLSLSRADEEEPYFFLFVGFTPF